MVYVSSDGQPGRYFLTIAMHGATLAFVDLEHTEYPTIRAAQHIANAVRTFIAGEQL